MKGIFLAAIIILPLILLLNVLLFHFFIRRAIKLFVKPELANKGLFFVDHKWCGFFDCGDFKNEQTEFALFKTGNNSIAIYAFVDYKDHNKANRVTVKIEVVGLYIERVIYSGNL